MRSAKYQNSNFEAAVVEKLVHPQHLNDHYGGVSQGLAAKTSFSFFAAFETQNICVREKFLQIVQHSNRFVILDPSVCHGGCTME